MKKNKSIIKIVVYLLGIILALYIMSINFQNVAAVSALIGDMQGETKSINIMNPRFIMLVFFYEVPPVVRGIVVFGLYCIFVKIIFAVIGMLTKSKYKKEQIDKKYLIGADRIPLNATGVSICPQCGGLFEEWNDKCQYCGYISPERSKIKDQNADAEQEYANKGRLLRFFERIMLFFAENTVIVNFIRIAIIVIALAIFVVGYLKFFL